MSLQIWLPLTKDLRQQGVSNITVTNNGATFNSAGKLGGCYIFDGADDAISIGNLSALVETNFSFACWFYHSDTWSTKSYETILGGPSGFELETKNGSTNSPVIKAYSWGGGSFTYELNKWNHLVMTRTSSETKFYLNGELKLTGTAGSIPSGDYFVGAWKTSTSQNYKGSICDVRIYDHCLSPMEVKKLSQGLVLHYPLNRQGWGQENLATQYVVPGSNGPLVTTTAGRTVYYGKYGITIPTTENADTYFSIYMKQALESGKKYTLSCEVNGLSNGTYYNFPLFAQNNSSMGLLKLDHNGLCSLTFTMNYTGTVATSTVDGVTLYRLFMDDISRSIASGQGAITVTNIKLEEGDKVTPWCPASIDSSYTTMGLNGTTEYDTSGYCNNGTRTGTFSWTSDTPKYAVSTTFSGSQYILADSPSSEGATLALWAKTTSTSNAAIAVDYKSKLGFGFYGGVIIPSCNSAIKTTYPVTNYNINQWNHIVVVRNNSSSIQLYINGVLQTAASNQDYWSGGVIDGLSVAARPNGSNPISCQVSDLRIYATALSAEDVKQLYNSNRL